jgi:hypothetical protein
MGLILARTTTATVTIFMSFVLSYIMLIGLGILWPEGLDWLVQRAKEVEAVIVQPDIPARYRVWLDLLIEEGAILLLFFTMVARILIALVLDKLGRGDAPLAERPALSAGRPAHAAPSPAPLTCPARAAVMRAA